MVWMIGFLGRMFALEQNETKHTSTSIMCVRFCEYFRERVIRILKYFIQERGAGASSCDISTGLVSKWSK